MDMGLDAGRGPALGLMRCDVFVMCAERGLGFLVDLHGWLWHPLNDPLSWVLSHVDIPTGMSLDRYIGAGGDAKCPPRRCAVLGSATRQQCCRVIS
jgi:hypothetical protein